MQITQNVSLLPYNTFGIQANARTLTRVSSTAALQHFLKHQQFPYFILGGGSNILLTGDVNALVLKNEIGGIDIVKEEGEKVTVAVGGGVNWHTFVLWCIEQGLGGVENLSLIPGTVGAAPIQNIGAYGVELKDVFDELEAIELDSGQAYFFDKKSCRFGYRDSIFKGDLKGQFLISRVFLKLSKRPEINISYGAIQQTLAEMGIDRPDIRAVSRAVIHIRQSKLPDPKVLGNSGSFFKNPEITIAEFEKLQQAFPNIVHYPLPNGKVKVPAGWLIEQCGWKGRRIGNTGAHARQALVLVNYGDATGQEVHKLALAIAESVTKKFGIYLQTEVNVIGG